MNRPHVQGHCCTMEESPERPPRHWHSKCAVVRIRFPRATILLHQLFRFAAVAEVAPARLHCLTGPAPVQAHPCETSGTTELKIDMVFTGVDVRDVRGLAFHGYHPES